MPESSSRKPWKAVWAAIASSLVAVIIFLDFRAAAQSVYSTFSYLGSAFAVRHPWVPFGIFGVLGGHMAMPHEAEPLLNVTGMPFLNFVLAVALYAAVWEGVRALTPIDTMGNTLMFANLLLAILVGHLMWPLRPSF